MFPWLFDYSDNITDYQTNGYGFLTEVVKCEVTEELNAEYTLAMSLLTTDRLAKLVVPKRCILAKPNYDDDPQIFSISKVNYKSSTNTLEVAANHIKNTYFNNMLAVNNVPIGDETDTISITGTPSQIISDVHSRLVMPNPFTFTSNITSSHTMNYGANETSLGEFFTDDKEGLLKTFGGDLKYNNFSVSLLTRRGSQDARTSVRYGSNISSYAQEMSSEKEYTHILPFAEVPVIDDQTLYSGSITAMKFYGLDNGTAIPTGSTSSNYRVLPVDFSYKFTSKHGYVNPSAHGEPGAGYAAVKSRLVTLGQRYVNNHQSLADSSVCITIDYESALDELDKVSLGDLVKVVYEPTGYVNNHRVTRTVFDSINEKFTSVRIGDRKYTLYDFIKNAR